MQSDIQIPSIDLLEDIAADLARTAQIAGDRPNAAALNKAAYRLPGVYDVLRFSAGDLLIPSATTAGQLYRVSGAGCSCEAGIHGRACWHSALAEIILVARDRQGDDDDGDDDDGDVEDGDPYETYAPPPDVDSEPFLCSGPLPDDGGPADLAPMRTRLARVIAAARAAVWQVAA